MNVSDLYAVGRVILYSIQRFESALYVQILSKSVGSTSLLRARRPIPSGATELV